jgi:ribosome-binding protein aMBF1 (putative translation factor)
MKKLKDFKSLKEKLLQDPKVRAEYEELRPEFDLIIAFIKARKAAKLSQAALAKELKLKQSALARLETGGYARTSYLNLQRVANTMGYSLETRLVKQSKKKLRA